MRALLAIVLGMGAGCGSSDPPLPSSIACGGGTRLEGNECVAPASSCGDGTHEVAGECLPDIVQASQYVIRASAEIVADGTRRDVIVFGRNADGSPATDQVVLNTDRPNAGTFDPPTFQLDERHLTATFIPCEASIPGCVGPLELTVALASAPTVPVARIPVELVATDAIGSVEHCLGGGNVLYLEGDKFIYRGALAVIDAAFDPFGEPDRAEVTVVPSDPIQGTRWTVELSSVELGLPLVPGVYRDALQSPPPAGRPGIKVFGNDPFAQCDQPYRGEFEVHEYVLTNRLERMTASFRQWCATDASPESVVSGCIHIE